MATKLSQINYSKRGKLSKREYAASQLGGKLDYKSGKITVKAKQPAKTTYKQSYQPSLSGDDADMGYIGTPEYQTYLNENNGKAMPDAEYNTKNEAFNTNKAKNKGISIPTRQQASKVYNAPKIPTVAGASTQKSAPVSTPKTGASSFMRGALETGLGIAKNLPGVSSIANLAKVGGVDITDILGIPRAQAFGDDYTAAQAVSDQQNFLEQKNDLVDSGIVFDDNGQVNIPQSTQNTKNGWLKPTSSGNQNQSSDRRTSARPVSSPFQTPTQNTTSWFTPQQQFQYNAPQQDFTPQQQAPMSTNRRFAGNGNFSNGQFNNGQGDYGFQGASTGTSQQDPNSLLDDLMSLLSVNKAQAAEFAPEQQMRSFSQPQPNVFNQAPANSTGYSAKNGGMSSIYGTDIAPIFNSRTNENPNPEDRRTKIEGTGGGVVAQNAQPTSDSLTLMQKQSKGFSAQEKAQKRATEELIKSIKKQYQSQIDQTNKTYDTQQTQGSSDLEKAKQADLLRLSGLMNFQANQSPDSEQRIQYEQRAQDESNNTLKDFLAKIMSARGTDITNLQSAQGKDISGAKQQLQQALGQIAQSRSANQMDIAKMIDDLKNKALDRSAKGNGGFTPVQQQAYLQAYGKDMQDTLGKYSKAGYGQMGREKAANELATRWSGIFDKGSIADDVFQSAPNGWEGSYQSMYGTPAKAVGSVGGKVLYDDGSIR